MLILLTISIALNLILGFGVYVSYHVLRHATQELLLATAIIDELVEMQIEQEKEQELPEDVKQSLNIQLDQIFNKQNYVQVTCTCRFCDGEFEIDIPMEQANFDIEFDCPFCGEYNEVDEE